MAAAGALDGARPSIPRSSSVLPSLDARDARCDPLPRLHDLHARRAPLRGSLRSIRHRCPRPRLAQVCKILIVFFERGLSDSPDLISIAFSVIRTSVSLFALTLKCR